MIELTLKELEHILFALEDWRSPISDFGYYKMLQNKLKIMIEELKDV